MEFGLGELFSLLCALSWAVSVILFKHSGESMSANALNLVKNSIGFALMVPTALLIEGLSLPQLSFNGWGILIISGLIGLALADTWFLEALRLIGASRTSIVFSLYSPFVVILSIVFLEEQLAALQWFSFALILAGILLVVYQKEKQALNPAVFTKGIVAAVGSIFLTACGIVMMKPILDHEGFFWRVGFRLLAGIGGIFLIALFTRHVKSMAHEILFTSHRWGYLFMASFLGCYITLLLWLAGFKYAQASVASVLNETANLFVVLMAWLFLGETLNKRKVAGVFLVFSGVILFLV